MMRCSSCAREIPDNSSFCTFCGGKQISGITCPSCNRVLEENLKFCPSCGSSMGVAVGATVGAVPNQSPNPYQSQNQQQYQNPYQTQYTDQFPPQHSNPIPAAAAVATTVLDLPAQAYVSVGKRFLATLLDGLIFSLISWLLFFLTRGSAAFTLIMFILVVGYFIVMEAMHGATVGKMALGILVLKTDLSPIDWRASVIRNLLRIVDGFFFYLVAAILVWTSSKRQRLGDWVANTLVIQKSFLA